MGIRQLEAAILSELKTVAKVGKLRQKDIVEWGTREIVAHEGETLFYLPTLRIHMAVMMPNAPKAAQDDASSNDGGE